MTDQRTGRDVFPADVARTSEQPDVAAVIHGLVWDYSRTGGWPIVGDDFGFAEWLAARLGEAGLLVLPGQAADPTEDDAYLDALLLKAEQRRTQWRDPFPPDIRRNLDRERTYKRITTLDLPDPPESEEGQRP